MWIHDRRHTWLQIILMGGRVLPRLWPRVLSVTGVSVVVTVLSMEDVIGVSMTPTPFNLIGWPLALFLGFRNSATYDRFWEGRKLWGSLVNQTRSLARQALTLIQPGGAELSRAIVLREIAFVHALRNLLRESSPKADLAALLPPDELERVCAAPNPPVMLLQSMGQLVQEARAKGLLDAFHVPVLEQSLSVLTDVQGACERIKSTPIPFSYTVLMHRVVGVYCALLPFGLAKTTEWTTPLVVMFISYAFFGLDAVGDELEQPFGVDRNDLPLSAISRGIERTLRMQLGEVELPPPLQPLDSVLQ